MLIELQNLIPEPIPQKIVDASEVWGTNLRIETNSNVLVSAQSGMGKSTLLHVCLLYTSPSPRDAHESRMPSSA